jgi:predicted  nucleic acid-binding Zn-ribbon protein
MAKTSINIQPIKGGSEVHNTREKELDYVNKELTPLNENYSEDTVSARMEQIKENYQQTTGQAMQKKATPIREGVIVIDKDTTMEQLKCFSKQCEQEFGIKAFQIHIHRDEGYRNAQEWKPNLHAHVVFDWTKENGKSIKLDRQDMSRMQTILSESLQMERGISSDKEHLSAIQYKTEALQEQLSSLENQAEIVRQQISNLQTKENVAKTVSKAAEKIGDLFGSTKNDKEKESLRNDLNALKEKASQQEASIRGLNLKNDYLQSQVNSSQSNAKYIGLQRDEYFRNNKTLETKINAISKEMGQLSKSFDQKAMEIIKDNFPALHECITKGIKLLSRGNENNRGIGF